MNFCVIQLFFRLLDYQYNELLDPVFGIMRDKNPEIVGGKQKKFRHETPSGTVEIRNVCFTDHQSSLQVVRVGSKKTAFANFKEIAKMLDRPQASAAVPLRRARNQRRHRQQRTTGTTHHQKW